MDATSSVISITGTSGLSGGERLFLVRILKRLGARV